jgi:hypothetical protein
MPISANHNRFADSQYISALPADDLINLAVKKQEMYTEGLTKVQQSVDAYGQLRNNIKTDVEREYFDKTMDNLVKTINSSAGLDFSMKGNVQAVLNIGKPLERDEYITTAISNGNEITRRQETLGKLKSDERSAANDADYFEDVQDYMKSGKLGYKLGSKEYTPYIDISKEINERMKGAKENGTVDIMMDGKYIKTESTKGLTPNEVAAKISAGLGAKEQNQLRIDAMYDLKQRGVEQGQAEVVGYYTNLKQASETTLLESQRSLKEAQDAYDKSPTESARQALEAVRAPLEEARVQVEVANKNLTKVSDPANFNPNQYVSLFTHNFIANQANAYAYRQVEQKIQADPYGVQASASNNAMKLASYNSQLRREEFQVKSDIVGTKLPTDARMLSGNDNLQLNFKPSQGLSQLADHYKETGITLTGKENGTSTVGKEITEANAAFTSADIKTPAGQKAIQDAVNKLNTSYRITGDTNLRDVAAKAASVLQAYKTYQTKTTGEKSVTKDGEFVEVNTGKRSMPADEFFNQPFHSLLETSQTQIYSRPRRSMYEMEQLQAMKGNNSSTPVPAPVESGDPDTDT